MEATSSQGQVKVVNTHTHTRAQAQTHTYRGGSTVCIVAALWEKPVGLAREKRQK